MTIFKDGKEMIRAWLTDGEGNDVDVDHASSSLGTIDVSHKRIHSDDSYLINDYIDLGAGATRQFIFTTPDTIVRMHFTHEISFEKESTIIFTEGVSTDADGTVITSFNRSRNSSNTTSLVVTHTPTNPTGGTILQQHREGDKTKVGGTVRGSDELILKQNTKYMIEITNNSAASSLTNWLFNWYEA